MSFKLPKESDEYFGPSSKKEGSPLKLKWNTYYFCFLAGLALDKPLAKSNNPEFIRDWPDSIRPYKDIYIGMLIKSQLRSLEKYKKNKHLMKEKIDSIVDSSGTHLTKEGHDLMNDFAHSGFYWLKENVSPNEYEIFLPMLYKTLKKLLDKNPL